MVTIADLVTNITLVLQEINGTNGPSELPAPYVAPPMLKKVHDILIVVLLVCVMFSMGCSITWNQVWGHVKKPMGVIIGMISQFILLPFSAYCLIYLFSMDTLHATGLLVLACSPGGVASNIFAYFCEGDLSLSVTMTSFSTVVALFMMPFNIWIYGRSIQTEALVIPYGNMSISLISLTTPVVFGMLINWKFSKNTPFITQDFFPAKHGMFETKTFCEVGSFAGFLIIIICQTLEVLIFPDIFQDVPYSIYIVELVLPLLGFSLGYLAASIFRLNHSIRRTISIEAGIQNVGTALTIISLSFPFEQLRKVWLFPFMYAFSMLAICILITTLYRLNKRFCGKSLDLVLSEKTNSFAQSKEKMTISTVEAMSHTMSA